MKITLLGFLKKELTQALRDPRMRVVLFLMPIIQMLVFGFAISTEVRNIRLAAVYGPSDSAAQEFLEHSYASGWFIPAEVTGPDPFQWIQSNQVDAVILVPPEGLTDSIARGNGQVQLLVDATNVIRAQAVERYLQAVLQKTAKPSLSPTDHQPHLKFDVRVLYNPSMESSTFMVPGVMSMIIGVVTVLLTSMSMAREKEMGTFETIISTPVKTWEVMLGKTVPYILLGMIDVPLVMGVAILIFNVPMRGEYWELALSAFAFILATVSIGTLISTYAKNQQQAMMAGFIFLFLANLLSGIMFPLENMPDALYALTYLNPLKFFVTLLRNIMLKGGDPSVVWPNIFALTLTTVVAIWIAYKRFKPTL